MKKVVPLVKNSLVPLGITTAPLKLIQELERKDMNLEQQL